MFGLLFFFFGSSVLFVETMSSWYSFLYIVSHLHHYYGEDYDEMDKIPKWTLNRHDLGDPYVRESECECGYWKFWPIRPGLTWILIESEDATSRVKVFTWIDDQWVGTTIDPESITPERYPNQIRLMDSGELSYLSPYGEHAWFRWTGPDPHVIMG